MIIVEQNLWEQESNIEDTAQKQNVSLRGPASVESPLTFIDLFAGIGGFHLAMHNNGAKCVFASEWDKFARQTYEANFRTIEPELFTQGRFAGDINAVNLDDIPPFDILCAGCPCQPFSYAGLGQGFEDQTRGTLFFEICKIIERHQPKAVFLENVKGIVSHKQGTTLQTILSCLNDLGYETHWKVISSLDFGLPQKRERWYCVAFAKHQVQFKFPKPLGGTPTLRDIIDSTNNDAALKLTQFELERIQHHFNQSSKQERVQHDSSKYAPYTKKGKYGIFSYQKADGSLRFHVGDKAKTQIQEAFYACLDTYAPTIIAGRTPKLWDLKRKLSVLEAKRLQGFPDEFIMPVSDNQAYKQLGNSVSVPVITAIAEEILKVLNNKK